MYIMAKKLTKQQLKSRLHTHKTSVMALEKMLENLENDELSKKYKTLIGESFKIPVSGGIGRHKYVNVLRVDDGLLKANVVIATNTFPQSFIMRFDHPLAAEEIRKCTKRNRTTAVTVQQFMRSVAQEQFERWLV
jgi:hypothetical protein